MKNRLLSYIVLLAAAVSAAVMIVAVVLNSGGAAAQNPERRGAIIPDTVMLHLDSLPVVIPPQHDTAQFKWYVPLNYHEDLQVDFSPDTLRPVKIEFDLSIPRWSIYRRSFKLWGITFSTGQADPMALYPASNSLNADVLSFPLQRPK